jgi:hypothetical protein
VDIEMDEESSTFIDTLNRQKLRKLRRRKGRYLLRTNLTENDPALLWQYYIQLVAVEQAFRNLKGDLAIRRSAIRTSAGSKLISSLPSWRTACKSRYNVVCMPWRRD